MVKKEGKMKKLNIIVYSIIAAIVLLIIFMIFVNLDFRDFVHELDQKNVYLYREGGEIMYGFTSPPYVPLSEEMITTLNDGGPASAATISVVGNNIFYFNRQSLAEKEIGSVTLSGQTYTKDEALELLGSGNLSFQSRTNVFASLAEEFESDYIFTQLKNENFEPYPDRLLWKFIRSCPESLTKFFTFKREVSI